MLRQENSSQISESKGANRRCQLYLYPDLQRRPRRSRPGLQQPLLPPSPLPRPAAVVAAMEPMLQRMLGLQAADALLLTHQARGLEAFAKIFGARPDLAAPAVAR